MAQGVLSVGRCISGGQSDLYFIRHQRDTTVERRGQESAEQHLGQRIEGADDRRDDRGAKRH